MLLIIDTAKLHSKQYKNLKIDTAMLLKIDTPYLIVVIQLGLKIINNH